MRFEQWKQSLSQLDSVPAAVGSRFAWSYRDLIAQAGRWSDRFRSLGVRAGDVVTLEGDFAPSAGAAWLGLMELGAVAMPLSSFTAAERVELVSIVPPDFSCVPALESVVAASRRAERPALLRELAIRKAPGFIVFTSGSTGVPKAILHDFQRFLLRFERKATPRRTLVFLQFDHLGGLNTLFHVWSSGGTAVVPDSRKPLDVFTALERHDVELLPATPSFLAALLAARPDFTSSRLPSLRLVSYGAEPMPDSVLARLRDRLPGVELRQTYGLSELGVLPIESRAEQGLWLRPRGEGVEMKVRDGRLWIRSRTAMLGYLNAPSPFDAEGWMDTGDDVELQGELVRVLGRHSERINVGGQKVYPAEVESVLGEMDNVAHAVAAAEPNALLGQIVVAILTLKKPEPLADVKERLRRHCAGRLAPYKIPAKIRLAEADPLTPRGKKRAPGAEKSPVSAG